MAQLTLQELAQCIQRRADGEAEALDRCWAPTSSSWRSYSADEKQMRSQDREKLSRSELDAFRRAMPDFTRTSTVHVSEETDTLFELSTWAGTAPSGPVRVELCLVYRVRHGLIERVEMYGDSGQFASLAGALVATQGQATA